jgi:hypothetical protein
MGAPDSVFVDSHAGAVRERFVRPAYRFAMGADQAAPARLVRSGVRVDAVRTASAAASKASRVEV